jgi:transcriptional regulator of acetoin/glycerol metabolism
MGQKTCSETEQCVIGWTRHLEENGAAAGRRRTTKAFKPEKRFGRGHGPGGRPALRLAAVFSGGVVYSLQRSGDEFTIREEGSGRAVKRAGKPKDRGDSCLDRSPADKLQYRQWKRFVETGKFQGELPHPALLDSWRRCREWEVDPSPRSCWDFAPVAQLEPFAGRLRELTKDIEKRTYAAIAGQNLLITMTDPQGRVVRTVGDVETLRAADRLNFGPGANWAEASVGTNAIGTSLVSGLPLQVFAEEHYCQSHHAWCCTAAPIHDPLGAVWGCFDISGPAASDHSRSLPLVLGAAREIERRLYGAYLAEIESKSRSLLSAVFNSVLTGVLTVDESGTVTNANQAAEALFGRPGRPLRGQRAEALFDFARFLERQRENPALAEAMTLACRTRPRLLVRAAPVFAADGLWCHTVVTVTETQMVHPVTPPARGVAPAACQAPAFSRIVHRSPAMARVVDKARHAARTPSTVLLLGESGTGKELFARGIHEAGPRASGPFVAVNCGALPRELAQSELFGYRAGAFTGAHDKGRIGFFEQASGGTLFLDEISEMPLELQVNLLRPLEERCVVRVGGMRCRPVDVKVIVATNRDLAELVAKGSFREDLYYRIHVVTLPIPPLRERDGDVPLLAEGHARRLCRDFGLPFAAIDAAAMDILRAYRWPGNVRELLNCIEYAVNAMEGEIIRPEHLPPLLLEGRTGLSQGAKADQAEFKLESVAAETIREALEHHGGNVSRTARALGIGRNTLYAKMRKFGLC